MWSGWMWEMITVSICSGEIPAAARFAGRWPTTRAEIRAVARVNEDQLVAGVDKHRIERHGDLAGWGEIHPRRLGDRSVLADIGDEMVGHRERRCAVRELGQFVVAHLVTIKSRRLRVDDRRACQYRACGESCGTGQQGTTGNLDHGVLAKQSRLDTNTSVTFFPPY